MINYIMNKKNKDYPHLSNKIYKFKINSFSNIHPKKKFNININTNTNTNQSSYKNKNANNINILNIKSPESTKKHIKFTKKLITELFKKREISPEDIRIRRTNNKNKTNNNSPTIKKIYFKRDQSIKKFHQKNNYKEHINLSLNNKYNNYICSIKKNFINHNQYSNLLNNTNITNVTNVTNNITTNFTNSINNSIGSITNHNSNNVSNKKIKIKENKNKEIKINIKILYKDIFYIIELNQFNNGLWLAKKVNEYYNINLNEEQIRHLAVELTKQINNIINCAIYFRDIKNFGTVININKIIKEYNDKLKKYRILVKYNNENYYFFINNKDDINNMVDTIIDNIIKKEKYDNSSLKDEIIKKINDLFDKTYNTDKLNI